MVTPRRCWNVCARGRIITSWHNLTSWVWQWCSWKQEALMLSHFEWRQGRTMWLPYTDNQIVAPCACYSVNNMLLQGWATLGNTRLHLMFGRAKAAKWEGSSLESDSEMPISGLQFSSGPSWKLIRNYFHQRVWKSFEGSKEGSWAPDCHTELFQSREGPSGCVV